MFKVSQSPVYTVPVMVELPGERTKKQFDAVFHRLSQGEIDRLMERAKDGEVTDNQFVREVLSGWNGVEDEQGPLEFNEANLATLLEVYPVAACIIKAYSDSLAGARLKN